MIKQERHLNWWSHCASLSGAGGECRSNRATDRQTGSPQIRVCATHPNQNSLDFSTDVTDMAISRPSAPDILENDKAD